MSAPERDVPTGRDPAARESTLREPASVRPGGVPFDPDRASAPASGFPAAPPSRVPTGPAAAPFTAPSSAPQPAPLDRRFAAFLLDQAVVAILIAAALSVFGPGVEQVIPEPPVSAPLLGEGWRGLLHLGVAWLYHAGGQSSAWQATPGKRMLGLRVIGNRGKRIGFGRASVRFASSLLSAAFCWLGYLVAAGDPNHKTLHDGIAETLVVRP